MIHATILETCADDGAERAALNHALMGTTPDPTIAPAATGPLRYARPGEVARDLSGTVPVHEALAALAQQMPAGSV